MFDFWLIKLIKFWSFIKNSDSLNKNINQKILIYILIRYKNINIILVANSGANS